MDFEKISTFHGNSFFSESLKFSACVWLDCRTPQSSSDQVEEGSSVVVGSCVVDLVVLGRAVVVVDVVVVDEVVVILTGLDEV